MEDASSSILPKNNNYVLGHDKQEQLFLNAWKKGCLHNSWIVSGIEGIGKATLVYKFARFLLSNPNVAANNLDISPNSPVFKQVANNSHPDLKIVERDYTDTDKRKIIKAVKAGEHLSDDELQGLKKSAFIRVDDIRKINEFLSKKSADNNWRVVIVDSVDELNSAGANAILKVLEEPPHKTIIFLISHNPNKLLPTILSRCIKISLSPLEDNIVASLLRRYRPELTEAEIKELCLISAGSIGKAIDYADCGALDIKSQLYNLLQSKNLPISDLLSFTGSCSGNDVHMDIVKELILKFIIDKMRLCTNHSELSEVWEYAISAFQDIEAINMDKKQTLINVISSINNVIK